MERLTLRSSDTNHKNGVCCTHFQSKECLEAGGNCAYGCKWEEAVWARLAEFEDSGIETWQADAAKSIVEMAFGGEISSIERIRDLVRADKAGMNIILPCKPGDKLFVLTSDSLTGIMETKCRRIEIRDATDGLYATVVAPCVYDGGTYSHWEFTKEDFGRTVFLNQEEAEKDWRKNELRSKGMSFYSER